MSISAAWKNKTTHLLVWALNVLPEVLSCPLSRRHDGWGKFRSWFGSFENWLWAGSVRLGLLLVLFILEWLRSGSIAIDDYVSCYVLSLPHSHMRADIPGEAFYRVLTDVR